MEFQLKNRAWGFAFDKFLSVRAKQGFPIRYEWWKEKERDNEHAGERSTGGTSINRKFRAPFSYNVRWSSNNE
jgi:hypothetical protein